MFGRHQRLWAAARFPPLRAENRSALPSRQAQLRPETRIAYRSAPPIRRDRFLAREANRLPRGRLRQARATSALLPIAAAADNRLSACEEPRAIRGLPGRIGESAFRFAPLVP